MKSAYRNGRNESIAFIVLEAKGGAGKSVLATYLVEALRIRKDDSQTPRFLSRKVKKAKLAKQKRVRTRRTAK